MRIATSASRIDRSSSVSSIDQADLDLGVEIEELANPRRQPGRAEGYRRGDLERAFGPVLRFGDQPFGHRQLGEYLARGAEQKFALLGQDQPAGMAVKQRHAKALLERADLAADRGLAEVQRFARMGKAARLGDRVENPQLVPIHAHAPGSRRAASGFRLPLFGRARRRGSPPAAARNFSASSAAMQPIPAAVTAWRNILSLTSPAANTPGMPVSVESGRVMT